ncbi:MAG TPA: sigma-70 family RNA polymerase sigma factor [Rhizobiaceae bacterium]|nr:sigma-70 family RNA polymerase sigma factor [Rhizobiaceae bacterium]
MQPTDDDLMAQIAKGDERAYSLLVSRHLQRVRAVAYGFCANHADTDDIAQSVFWKVWTHAGSFEPGAAKFTTWLYRITTNACIDHGRRKRLKSWIGLDVIAEWVADRSDPAREHAGRTELAETRKALDALPERQRLALMLSVEGEMANGEIGAALGLTTGAVEQLLVRARRSLRDWLSGQGA